MLSALRLASPSSWSRHSIPSSRPQFIPVTTHKKLARPIGRCSTSSLPLTVQWRLAHSKPDEESYHDDDGFALQYFAKKSLSDLGERRQTKSRLPKPSVTHKPATPDPTKLVIEKKVEILEKKVPEDFVGGRLDRFVSNLFPKLPNSRINKLLREKKITVKHAGEEKFKKVEGGERLKRGSLVKFRGVVENREGEKKRNLEQTLAAPPKLTLSPEKISQVRSWVLHKDESIIVINKPPNLAVQGGTGIKESVDDVLEALQYDSPSKPRLVHRLDQGASGLLVLARDRQAAQSLTKNFAKHDMNKLYWAICLGTPKRLAGSVRCGLRKQRLGDDDSERVYVVEQEDMTAGKSSSTSRAKPDIWDRNNGENDDSVKPSHTRYHTMAHTHNVMSMLALRPRTGRTHQLRVHCAQVLGTPIFGDYKYGPGCPESLKDMLMDEFDSWNGKGSSAASQRNGSDRGVIFADRPGVDLHLHAREIAFNHPRSGEPVHFTAPVPSSFMKTMKHFDYNLMLEENPHATLLEEERKMKPYEFKFQEGKLKQKLRLNQLSKSKEYQSERRRDHALRDSVSSAPKQVRARLAKHKESGNLTFSSLKSKPKPKTFSSHKNRSGNARRRTPSSGGRKRK